MLLRFVLFAEVKKADMHEGKRNILKEWIRSIIEAAIILAVLFVFFWPAQVEGVSMSPSINDNDRVIICRFAAYTGMYEKGDLVVFDDEDYSQNMIKRIIAVEGDTLHIADGKVYVNGEELEEDYAEGYTEGDMYMVIPQGCVFVMGDNREKSIDSRYFGVVSTDNIYGRVLMRFFPLNEIEIFK